MNWLKKNWLYALLSLLLAILLFVYVNQTKLSPSFNSGGESQVSRLSSTKQDDISVPLQLNVDSNKYFVTDYPEKVTVHLSGPTALVSTVVNTQNFRVLANLNGFGVGWHRVHPVVSGLNSEIKAHVTPGIINPDVQPRQTVNFPVKVEYDHSRIAAGYHAEKPVKTIRTVKVSGAAGSIRHIKSVIAQLSLNHSTKHSVDRRVALEALDRDHKTVDVILTPATERVELPVKKG